MFYNRFTSRREMMKSTMALFAAGLLGKGMPLAEAQSAIQNVNKHSSPSTLRITDLRYTVVKKPGPGSLRRGRCLRILLPRSGASREQTTGRAAGGDSACTAASQAGEDERLQRDYSAAHGADGLVRVRKIVGMVSGSI